MSQEGSREGSQETPFLRGLSRSGQTRSGPAQDLLRLSGNKGNFELFRVKAETGFGQTGSGPLKKGVLRGSGQARTGSGQVWPVLAGTVQGLGGLMGNMVVFSTCI